MMRDLLFIAAIAVLCSIEFVYGGSPFLLPGSQPYVTVPENYPVGGELFVFHIIDSDIGDIITVTPTDSFTAIYVNITATTGHNITVHVTLKKELDREDKARLTLNFTANDRDDMSGNQITITKTVYVTDVNDNAPQFQNQPYTMNIPELPCTQTIVYTNISATDTDGGDNGTVRYRMEATSQSDTWKKEYMETFSIDNITGHVNLTKCLDYEHNNYYQFNVMAYDLGNPPQTSFVSLIIRVLDVQDTPPFFTGIPYRATVDENINTSTSILSVNARDGDPGISNTVKYSIINGTCDGYFQIDSSQGIITPKVSLDRDNGTIKRQSGICIITVMANEIDKPNQTQYNSTNTTTDVTITINDVNDNSPKFNFNNYTAEVPENTPTNVPVTLKTEIAVEDADQGNNAKMTITLNYHNDTYRTAFSVSPPEIQGYGKLIILVNDSSVLDYETTKSITIEIIATEVVNTSHSCKTTVVIAILDQNDNNPKFSTSINSNLEVAENSNSSTLVGTIAASDVDTKAVNGQIQYSLSGGNRRFVVNSTTGEIRTNCSNCSAELDREKQDVYYMTYTAKDGGDRSDSISLVVTLTDVNDNTPIFSRAVYQAFVQENDEHFNSSPIVQLEATDNDLVGTNNSTIVYTILKTSPVDFFNNLTVNFTGGELFLSSPVDYEKINDPAGKINITVQATDRGNPFNRWSTALVVLSVQDENDNQPIFNHSSYTAHVKEDATSNLTHYTTIEKVFATDADVTERNNKLNYFITSGSSDRFTINSTTGMVSVQLNAVLDREQVPLYNLTIIAIDQGSPPLTGTTTMSIHVTDVNDEMPKFVEEQFTASIKEDSQNGTNVFNCIATDPDTDNNLAYSIKDVQAMDENGKKINSSSVSSYFDVHSNNGTVYVKEQLDRETAATVILTLLVNDTAAYLRTPQTATATLTITLLDVNDNPPHFDAEVYNDSVIENARNGYILTTLHATDKDINRTITYGILYGEAPTTSFAIDNKTGLLTKNGSLDRETNSSVTLTVIAWDNGEPQKSSSAKVVVTILDFNDNSPQFDNFSRNIIVDEDEDNGTVVLNVSATDADENPNNVITYSMEGGLGDFVINRTTGSISVLRELDREQVAEYKLKVIARDHPFDINEQKSNETIITVNIGDINDNPPVFPGTQFKAIITEEEKPGKSILTVSATDQDDKNTQNANITYELNVENNITGLFVMDSFTGIIYVNSSLIDKDNVYLIQVIAYDHGHPQLNASTMVNITVLDKNLNQPFITNIPNGNLLSVYECANVNFSIYNFTFTDEDHGVNAMAHFNIASSGTSDNVSNVFNITSDGNLQLIGKLNVNKKNTYTFEVQATDEGIPPLTSPSETLTVIVIDVNDHEPSFPRKREKWSVQENSTDYINTVQAYDDDKDSLPCYSFNVTKSNGTEYFAINKTTGDVKIVKALDREVAEWLTLAIDVADCTKSKNVTGCNQNDDTTIQKVNANVNKSIEISITVLDINDNPPVFKDQSLATGMRRNTMADTELQIHLRNESYISDKDTKINGVQSWSFSNYGNITTNLEIDTKSGKSPCEDNVTHIFCVTGNGDIVNNKLFDADLSGYFIVGVKVSDRGGWDIANITIYLIADTQILTMVVLGGKEAVSGDKDNILQALSEILGDYTAVFDSLQDHQENNQIDKLSTDLSFHLVNNKDQSVVPGPTAVNLIDKKSTTAEMDNFRKMYSVFKVNQQSALEASKDNDSNKNMYILLAVSVGEAVVISIIIYVYFSTRHKYQRKLKAANIKPTDMELHVVQQNEIAVPGSNMYSKQNNPLLNAQVNAQIAQHDLDDSSSVSFDDVNLDENEVGDPQTVYDRMEEKEVTLDMYGDDVPRKAVSSDDLLADALQSYKIHKSMESLDNLEEERPAPTYLNPLFHEDLESTEI